MVKNLPTMQETQVQSLGWKEIPWRREWLPTPVFWPGEFHGLYSPWGLKESDTAERLSLHCFKKKALGSYESAEYPMTQESMTLNNRGKCCL